MRERTNFISKCKELGATLCPIRGSRREKENEREYGSWGERWKRKTRGTYVSWGYSWNCKYERVGKMTFTESKQEL